MSRRCLILACVVALGVCLLAILTTSRRATALPIVGQKPPANKKIADLKNRLEKGLKARRPTEFAFIAKVVQLTEKGKLPRKLVDGTYFWARKKRRHQFQYFERALIIRARRLGIKL